MKAQRKNAKLFMRPHVPPNMSKNGLASLLEILNVKNYQLSSAELGARLKKVSNMADNFQRVHFVHYLYKMSCTKRAF